jgi:two-component system, OmpR family, phosphate regulon sensor histidine kinase PhoR
MMYKKRHSLVLRIALAFALLLVLTMGLLSLYLYSFIQRSYLEILENNLTAETRLLADRIAVRLEADPENTAEIHDLSRRYANLLGSRVTIIATDGVVLGESHLPLDEIGNHINRPEVQRALQNEVSTQLRYSDTVQTQMLYAAAPILSQGNIIGVARMAVSTRTIQRNESSILRTVLIATAVATLLSILLAGLVAAYTVQPIKQLTNNMQRFANGIPVKVSPTRRGDEIGQLHRAFHEMSHQLNAQIDELRTERSKLEVVLANINDGIVIVDSEGNVQLINPAALRLFKINETAALKKSLIEVVRHHQLVELWRKSSQYGQQETTTLETSPDRLFVQGIATPLEHSLAGMTLLLFQDLTRVRRLETIRRDFVSNVSHELRTPLASLKALAETLQESALEDPPAARRFLQRMETEIDNLTQMVHELLELSRIESNRFPLRKERTDPCKLAAPAVERMQLQAERVGLRLEMDCPPDLPYVNADAGRIEQVLVNLIHNAVKFTPPGGDISVSAYQEGKMVVFSIRDSGVGMSYEALPRIFERFYKADRSRSGGGTGLGLSIARHIIEAHGGRIWAESTENQGSTFFFSLPTQ